MAAHACSIHMRQLEKPQHGSVMQGQQDQQAEGEQANGHAEAAEEGLDPIRQFMRPPPNRPTVSSEHLPLHSAQHAACTE